MLSDHNRWRGIDDPAWRTPVSREQGHRNLACVIVAAGLLVNFLLWMLWSHRLSWPDIPGGFFA